MRRLLVLVLAGAVAEAAFACAQGSSGDEVPKLGDASADVSVGQEEAGEPVLVDGSTPSKDSGGSKDTGTVEDTGSGPCTAGVGKVVINEIQTAGASASDEFIELYNNSDCEASLKGWSLNYSSASGSTPSPLVTFTTSDKIAAHAFFVVATGTFTDSKKDATYTTGGLAAGGGRVGLVEAADKVIDGVGYGNLTVTSPYVEGTSAPAPTSSKSIGRMPDGKDTNNNSADFAERTPTPRAPN